MADTRCVNPAYQLDIDVMILEHLLYHAIRAQFESLRPRYEKQTGHDNDEIPFRGREREAERLLHAFDSKYILTFFGSLTVND